MLRILPKIASPKRPLLEHVSAVIAAAAKRHGGLLAGAAGLDSWANVYLVHVDKLDGEATDEIRLADGSTTKCRSFAGEKGIPTAQVVNTTGGECNNLLPAGWLHDRGCVVRWDGGCELIAPKGREMRLQRWEGLPFLTKEHIHKVMHDLPDMTELGRKGTHA